MASHVRSLWAGLLTFICSAALGCGGGEPPIEKRAAALASALDTSDGARAAFYAAEVARYRDIANQERQWAAAYARWTPPARATKNWNATLEASADARAAAADAIAVREQAIASFHAAKAAAKEAGR